MESIPKFRVRPFGLKVFTDLDRNKSFPVLCFRHKKPGELPEQLDLVEIVVEDLAAAGLSVAGAVTVTLTPRADDPHGGNLQAGNPPAFGSVLEVPVAVPGEVQAWCAALRASAERRKGETR